MLAMLNRALPKGASAPSTAEPPECFPYRCRLSSASLCAPCLGLRLPPSALDADVAELSGATFTVWAVALLPLYALLAKAGGLYDRDQFILHKTTLDEAPALLAVAALFTIVIEAVQALEFTGRSHPLLLWGLLGATLVCRAFARFWSGCSDGQRAVWDARLCRIQPDHAELPKTPRERVVVGESRAYPRGRASPAVGKSRSFPR